MIFCVAWDDVVSCPIVGQDRETWESGLRMLLDQHISTLLLQTPLGKYYRNYSVDIAHAK